MDLQIQTEENPPDQSLDRQEYFPSNSPVSHLSSVDALAELVRFRNSPFYAYYIAQAQAQSDEATKKVFSPLDKEDPYAIQHREQLIGEASAYLFIGVKAADDLLNLQKIVTEQQEQNGNS
jgi:hypothetical protein